MTDNNISIIIGIVIGIIGIIIAIGGSIFFLKKTRRESKQSIHAQIIISEDVYTEYTNSEYYINVHKQHKEIRKKYSENTRPVREFIFETCGVYQ